MCNFTGGTPPTDVAVEQTDLNTVLVTWTAPSPPPTNGYRVKLSGGSSVTVTGTSHIISVGQRGVYTICVTSLYQNILPSEAAEGAVTVRGIAIFICYRAICGVISFVQN